MFLGKKVYFFLNMTINITFIGTSRNSYEQTLTEACSLCHLFNFTFLISAQYLEIVTHNSSGVYI